ncbi:MAG: transposase [Rhodococcus sp. (in: high G+C Gram-positive bacteria)]
MMSKTQTSYLPETREGSLRLVFDTRSPDESLKAACMRVSPLVNVRFATLYNWCKQATPTASVSPRKAQTVGELEAENRSLKKELRETKRANEILKAAATFFGAEIDRQSQR